VGGGSGKVVQPLLSATNRGRVNNDSAFFVAALTMNIIDHLPLSALSVIFPYRSHMGTLAKGIGDHIHLGGGLSRGVRFPT
jgi:hypothetical protein